MSLYKGNNLISGHQVLYSTTGNNTDGAMTQSATTTQLDNKLNKQQITNCILEAPNGVYSVSGRSLTIKAELKVLFPNGKNADGTLNNIEYTLPNDATFDCSSYSNGQYRIVFLYDDGSKGDAETKNLLYVKDTLPQTVSNTNYHYCYNASTNLWYVTHGSTTANWSVVKAAPLLTFFTETNNLTITDSKTPVQLVDTDMADGQWVSKPSRLASNTTAPTSTDITYNLSSYLPNDGYIYEVWVTGSATTGSTSGNYAGIDLQSDISSDMYLCYARTRASAGVISAGSLMIPVGNARTLTALANSSFVGTFNLWVKGYRRIGINN